MSLIQLSFILPCFNVENYIEDCLDSLYKQDIPEEEYEIICINDCSTDKTREIIENYQKNKNNLFLINHTENKTAGGARNTGINRAGGEYIWFVDGDDMIKPNVLRRLLALCVDEKLDILLFNHGRVNQRGLFLEKDNTFRDDTNVIDGVGFVNTYFHQSLSRLSIIWMQIYRTNFLKKNNICFPEINIGEDGPFSWRSLVYAHRVKSLSDSFYLYRCSEGSMTAEFNLKPDVRKLFEKAFSAGSEIISLTKEVEKLDKEIADDLFKIALYSINSFSDVLINKYNQNEKKIFIALCKSNSELVNKAYPFLGEKNKRIINSMKYGDSLSLLYMCFEKIRRE